MNPKLKAILISSLFFPLNIIVIYFCTLVFSFFFQIFNLYSFSYYVGLINSVIGAMIASFFILKLSKDNQYFSYLISLPIIGTLSVMVFYSLFIGVIDSLVILENFILLFTYIYFIKNNKSSVNFFPVKKIGRLQVLFFISWAIISMSYVCLSGDRNFSAAITWGSIDWREENTLKLILTPLAFILIIPFLKNFKGFAFILITSFHKKFNNYFKGLLSLKFIGWIIITLLIAIVYKLYT